MATNKHWWDDQDARKRLLDAARERGMDYKALCQLLDVKDLHAYAGTAAQAHGVLATWDERQAPAEEAPAIVTAPADAGPTTAAPAPAPSSPRDCATPVAGDEALASFSVKAFSPSGFDCLVCIRDTDTHALMTRAEALLAWLATKNFTPPPPRSYNGNGGAQAASGGGGDGTPPTCKYHGAMKRSKKFNGWYCVSKMGDGSYCPEKVMD
jgi:hypothetical protein